MCIRNRNFLLSKLLLLRFTVWFLNGFLIIFFFFYLLYKFIYNFNLYSSYFLFLRSFSCYYCFQILFCCFVAFGFGCTAAALLYWKNFLSISRLQLLYMYVCCVWVCVWYIGNLLLLLIRILLLDLIQTPILKLNALPTSTAAAAASERPLLHPLLVLISPALIA